MNMYLCAEISNCLLFTVLLHYASINDFTRIDKIKTVKGFEKNASSWNLHPIQTNKPLRFIL